MRRGLIVAKLAAVAAILIFVVPAFADALLSGTIKSSDGKAMAGVTVSAKPDGGTITTSVFTDAAGNIFFRRCPAETTAYGRRRSATRPPRAPSIYPPTASRILRSSR